MRASSLTFLKFALVCLSISVLMGLLAAWVFMDKGSAFSRTLPFERLRPLHVSAAVFWILTAAMGGLYFYMEEIFPPVPRRNNWVKVHFILWLGSVCGALFFLAMGYFGGREYYEYPPILNIPIGICWLLFALNIFRHLIRARGKQPVYVWMFGTGTLFFLICFAESNLWMIPYFREHFIRDLSVQWKSNGAIVGSWNQLIYGTSFYLMTRMSKDHGPAFEKKTFFFYFLGLTNLMFNWGHHIYNVPGPPWVRHVSYGISMTEWLIFLSILHGFRAKISESERLSHLLAYRFLLASEFWVFLNLFLALLMSIPAVNVYAHGTHVTVAHAMGTTIGINSMILLGSFSFIFSKVNPGGLEQGKKAFRIGFWLLNVSLFFFWAGLIFAGFMKGVWMHEEGVSFQVLMQKAEPGLWLFAAAGIGVFGGLLMLAISFLKIPISNPRTWVREETPATKPPEFGSMI